MAKKTVKSAKSAPKKAKKAAKAKTKVKAITPPTTVFNSDSESDDSSYFEVGPETEPSARSPKKPAKGISPFIYWMKTEGRDKIKKKYPGISFGEVSKKGGEMWKKISQAEKNTLKVEAGVKGWE